MTAPRLRVLGFQAPPARAPWRRCGRKTLDEPRRREAAILPLCYILTYYIYKPNALSSPSDSTTTVGTSRNSNSGTYTTMAGGKRSKLLQGAPPPPPPPQWSDVRGLLHMRLTDAAAELNVSITYLRRLCRQNGFAQWPGKKVTHAHEHDCIQASS